MVEDTNGEVIPPSSKGVAIELTDVEFAYPTRPETRVLKGVFLIYRYILKGILLTILTCPPHILTFKNAFLQGVSLRIEEGQTVAFVGPSGCGKSTVFALLERWYDVDNGSVKVNGTDVRGHTLEGLRSAMALVGQEPVLFNAKVFENISFGLPPQEQPLLNACV